MKRRLFTLFVKVMLRRAPIARIDFPRQGRSYLVLDEAAMWGPHHVGGTAMPEQAGNCVVEFAALREIELGDEIVLRTREGKSAKYRVRGQVANGRTVGTHSKMLTLVTPRYAIVATPV